MIYASQSLRRQRQAALEKEKLMARKLKELDVLKECKALEEMMAELTRYIEDGELPSEFLQAVVCDDICQAAAYPEANSTGRLAALRTYMVNEAPGPAWGTFDKMMTWSSKKLAEAEIQRMRELDTTVALLEPKPKAHPGNLPGDVMDYLWASYQAGMNFAVISRANFTADKPAVFACARYEKDLISLTDKRMPIYRISDVLEVIRKLG